MGSRIDWVFGRSMSVKPRWIGIRHTCEMGYRASKVWMKQLKRMCSFFESGVPQQKRESGNYGLWTALNSSIISIWMIWIWVHDKLFLQYVHCCKCINILWYIHVWANTSNWSVWGSSIDYFFQKGKIGLLALRPPVGFWSWDGLPWLSIWMVLQLLLVDDVWWLCDVI